MEFQINNHKDKIKNYQEKLKNTSNLNAKLESDLKITDDMIKKLN